MRLGEIGSRYVILSLLMLALVIGTTESITDHNLYWGIEINDIFNYRLELRFSDSSRNEDFDYFVEVDSLPAIPENVTDFPYIGSSSGNEWNTYFSFFFMNETEITPLTSVHNLHWSAYPLGNWSFVEDYVISELDTDYWEVQQLNTETEWGLIITADEFNAIHTDTARYSKDDGALNFLEMKWQYDDGRFRKVRTIRVGEDIPAQVIVGVVAVSIGLLVTALVVLKKRS
ncbi:MAG: hypothetical protein ACXAEF_16325 [Candidatus Thorarchaeota archaeon]|jgi:hypothetical protein